MNKRYIGIFGLLAALVVIVTLLLTPAGPLAAQDTQATIIGPPLVTQALTTTDTKTTDTIGIGIAAIIALFAIGGIGLAAAAQVHREAAHKQDAAHLGGIDTIRQHDIGGIDAAQAAHLRQRDTEVAQAKAAVPGSVTRPLVARPVADTTHVPTDRQTQHRTDADLGHLTTPTPPTSLGRPTYMGPSQI